MRRCLSSTFDQKTVVQSDYDKWSDDNTVDANLMVHTFIWEEGISYSYPKIEHILQKFYEKTKIKFHSIHTVSYTHLTLPTSDLV